MTGQRIARRVEQLLADAHAALREGEHAEAHVLARAILSLDPGNAEADALVEGSDQRVQVTLMFCDLVGSTELADQRDPEEMSDILREYRVLCTDVIGRYGGFIEDRQGDGLLVRFGYPWVHEDAPRRAVLSGLEIVRAIGTHPLGLHVRIAIHTGLVVLDGGEVVGAAPNEAARLQGLAAPDSVLISDATYALVRGHFDVRAKGEVRLRGVSRPIGTYAVVGAGAGEWLDVGAGLTPFVGRRADVARVGELWQRVLRELASERPAPAAMLIRGPAGIGKSRLARESARTLGATTLACDCSSYHAATSLRPFSALLETICAIEPSDDSPTRLAKLRAQVARSAAGDDDDLPVLTTALSIAAEDTSPPPDVDPTRLRALALLVGAALVRSAASGGPLVVVIDDLHWADESSLELIGVLLSAPCPGLLVLMTARPEFVVPWSEELVDQLTLEPLPRGDLEQMALHVTDGEPLADELRDDLVARSDGIPLFLEELVRSSALPTDLAPDGAWQAPSSRIPNALRDPLLARLVVPGVDLALTQIAATIGSDIDRSLLQRACELDDKTFASKLANLVAAGLVETIDDGRIRFRHDLLREVAYETQRTSARRTRHGVVADLLRGGAGTHAPDAASLALHLERAARYDEAVDALFAAAEADQALGAHAEAIAKLDRGLALVERLPEGATRLLLELKARQLRSFGATMLTGYAAPETAQDHARCVEICEHLGLAPDLLPSLMISFNYYLFRGDLDDAGRVWTTIQRLASGSELPEPSVALARSLKGFEQFFRGAFDDAREILRAFLADPRWTAANAPDTGWRLPNDPASAIAGQLLVTLSIQGEQAAALAVGAGALPRLEPLSFPYRPFSIAFVKCHLAVVHMLAGTYETALELGDETAALGDRHGFAMWSLIGRMQAIASRVQLGDASQLDTLTFLVGQFRTLLSSELWAPYWLTQLAAAEIASGRPERSRARLDEALRVAALTGSDFFSAETLRVRGLLRCDDDDAGGLDDLRAAVAKARSQRAGAFEARAAAGLTSRGARQTATP